MSFAFLHDKDFFRAMLAIAAPVAFQQLITAGPNMMDVLMVGQLGETAVAALGLANQIFFLLFIRALRAGGDTRYAMFTELFSIWLIGVPSALFGGFVLHLPMYWVYALVLLEEVLKAVVIFRRFLSRKWIHDLVNLTGDQQPVALSSPEAVP